MKQTLKNQKKAINHIALLATLLFSLSEAQAQTTLVIPQVVDGGAWLTTIAITNTSANPAVASLSFFQETGGGNTSSWPLNFVEMTSAQTQNMVLAGGTSLFLHTLGTAATTNIGWGQLSQTDSSSPVVAYAIFTQRVPGQSDQSGTSPAAPAVSRILVPFNNLNAVTSMAIANTTGSSENISVGIRTAAGTTQPTPITLPPNGHASFAFPTQFQATAGQSGLAEFYSASGSFSVLALIFQSAAFTTAPVYSVSGPPIIATGGGGGNGNIVSGAFTLSKVSVTLTGLGTTTNSETVGGEFYSFTTAEWQNPFSGPTFGPCSVLQTTMPPAKAPYLPDTSLDAGTVTVSGPGIASGTVVTKSTTQTGPTYDLRTPTGTIAFGGTYTISSNGGSQVGPFSISATMPNSFSVTNWDSITSINRASGLTINWAGSGFDTVVIGATGQTNTQTVTVSCVVAGNLGTFSVPQGALALLPATQISSLTVSATKPTPGTSAAFRDTNQNLVPNLVGGGQVNYGDFAPTISILKSLPIL